MLFENVSEDKINWPESGLVPGIVQDFYTGRVLMLAYVNRESLAFMQEKGEVCFWSRSRKELWHKGATSNSVQIIKTMAPDCENNSILIQAEQTGKGACHTGSYTCFGDEHGAFNILEHISELIQDRDKNPKENSYTNYLLNEGVDKICKKIGEESAEVIIAAKNNAAESNGASSANTAGRDSNLSAEIADLTYHLLVLMYERGVSLREIATELSKRGKY